MNILVKQHKEEVFEMAITRKQIATAKAQETYKNHFDINEVRQFGDYETNLTKLVDDLELTVVNVDIREMFKDNDLVDKTTSGFLLKTNEEHMVVINKNQNLRRKRFTLAHEIGHYLLGHLSDVEFGLTCRNSKSAEGIDIEEIEANTFAAELLVPEELIREWHKANKSPRFLAEIFNVSESVINYRLKNLELI